MGSPVMKVRRLPRKGFEKLFEVLKSFRALRFRVSHSSLMITSLLFLTLLLAFVVRLLPLRWGFYLSEFDPYYQYRLTKHMVENGLFAWVNWRDTMSWYPYGRDVARTSFPGLALTAASSHLVANALGLPITLYDFCVVFPVIMGALTCLVMYFLGKDIGGKDVGLFSALFLALSSSHISRTSLGFFDDETVGVFGILLFSLFFLRSIETERPLKTSLVYAVASGLSLGYIFASWGASRYPVGMAVLLVFVLLLLRKYSSRLLFSYSITFGTALFIATNVPYLGFRLLTETTILAVFGVFLLLCAYEITSYIKTLKVKTIFVLVFLALFAASFFMLWRYGYIRALEAKFMSVLNPFERLAYPLVQSVAEHRPAAWGSLYYELGIGAFFIPIGLFFTVQNPTNRNLYLCIFGLTSIYFASSMVRLTLLMAPALSILWALALIRLLRPFVTIMREAPIIPRRKMRLEAHVGKEFSGAFIIMMFLLLTFTFVLPIGKLTPHPRVFDHAYSPTTIASASVPVKPDQMVGDWIDTLNWMRENLPPSPPYGPTVVASWWDYGYWITTVANKTTLADNATFNWTQIRRIATMFLSNETEAVQILKQYDVTHVVVFTVFDTRGSDTFYGDEGKWRWMAQIAGLNETNYWDKENRKWNERGENTVIYKLMTYGKETRLRGFSSSVFLQHFILVYYSKGPAIRGSYHALVCVYEVRYG
ncbi:MAG: Oligosaccharyl transferase STT3 subunit [Candidatus Bathyarchaeota archaeon BA1]|nr:MAG: Oligosaccharyl transferase STT3 subunit [Candidatus Bathyarchaeota archaeon BA1]